MLEVSQIIMGFFPMLPDYLACFTNWETYLRNDKMFGQEDALFPRPERRLVNGKFVFDTVSRETYANGSKVNEVFKTAFAQVQMHPYGAHIAAKARKEPILQEFGFCCVRSQRRSCCVGEGAYAAV